MSASEPANSNGIVPSLFTAGISEDDAHARATSSITMAVARASAPAPPYSSGMCGAWKSAARSASYEALGNSPVSSASAAFGATRVADLAHRRPDRRVLLGQLVNVERALIMFLPCG